MTKLIITRGLPGSGKSTWAKEWVAKDSTNRARINRDDLRQTLYGLDAPLPFELEKNITIVQHNAVKALLRKDISVVVDDTHLRQKFITAWEDITRELNVDFEVNDSFLNVDVSLCVQRDLDRFVNEGGRYVTEEVIRDMHSKFINSMKSQSKKVIMEPYTYIPDTKLPAAYIFDVDGTLAHHNNNRSPYDWSRVGEDTVDENVANILNIITRSGIVVLLLSGRDSVCRDETVNWLSYHNIDYDKLIMRAEKDNRKDSIIKLELFQSLIAPKYNVLGVFDDRNQVVEMWRSIGLTCFQVAEGAF